MKITFLGLSSFLIENKYGHRILIDPYNDSPRYSFGINFPKTIEGERLTAELILLSHMDADHASFRPEVDIEPPDKSEYQKMEYKIKFPNLDLRGTMVREWNGFPNIAWSYNIDNFRLWHLADNAHVLSKSQIEEAGKIDILFISPSKMPNDLKTTLSNIKRINPKYVVWAHHIPVRPSTETAEDKVRAYFTKIVLAQKENPRADQKAVAAFTNFWQNILSMNKIFKKVILIDKHSYMLSAKNNSVQPTILFFRQNVIQ